MVDLAEFEDLVVFRQEDENGNISLDRGDILELIDMVRQTEKDAARYRWMMNNARLGTGRFGRDWELSFHGPAPESFSEIGEWIDTHSPACVYGPLAPVMK